MTILIATTATGLSNLISTSVMHALGWALLHFLWQGAALAALAAVAMSVCHRPSARYLAGVTVLGLMLLTPVAIFLFYLNQDSGVADTAKSSPLAAVVRPRARGSAVAGGSIIVSPVKHSLDALPWVVEAWLLGVLLFSLRFTGGFLLLERERRKQSSALSPRALAMC